MISLTEKPSSVPDWVWEGYREWNRKRHFDPDGGVVESVLQDDGCAVVWKAMDRRRGSEWPNEEASDAVEALRTDVKWIFFARLTIAARGLTPEGRVPAAVRVRQGRAIEQLASELRRALLDACIAPGDWPHPFGIDLANSMALRYLGKDSANWWVREAAFDPNSALASLCGMLGDLERPARAWAGWKSSVGQPGSAQADRLHFLREMTDFFRRVYGSPLREPVAALTRCVYQCDIDAATVAKLAP